jgi:hypothetical protein
MALIYPSGDHQVTPNLGLGLWGTNEVVDENFILLDTAFGSVGILMVNGSVVNNPNFVNSASVTLSVVGSNISLTAATSTPGGSSGNVQGNNAGVFGGLPGSVIDFTNGLLALATVGFGVALSVTGDSSSSNIQNWYVNGQSGSSWGMSAVPYGDAIGVQLSMVDSSGNTATLDSGASDGLQLSSGANLADLSVNNGLFVRNITGSVQIKGNTSTFLGSSIFMQPASGAYNGSTSGIALTIVGSNTGDLSRWYTNGSVLAVSIDATGNLNLPLAGIQDHTGSLGTSGMVLSSTGTQVAWITPQAGTVTSFSAGNLSPLFTTSVATVTTTPALTFSLSTQTANTVFAGPTSGGATAPTFRALVTADIPTGTVLWNQIGNASGNLTLANAGFTSTFNQTSAIAWLWANTTIATALTTNASPTHQFAANYWTGAASAQDTWTIGSSLTAGANGASTLAFVHTGSTGLAYMSSPGFKATITGSASNCTFAVGNAINSGFYGAGGNNGVLCATGGTAIWQAISGAPGFGLQIISNSVVLGFALNVVSNTDIAFSRLGAGSLALGNGTAGNTTGNLSFNRVSLSGADFAGQATVTAGGTTKAVTFAANYTGTGQPVIVITPTSDPLALGVPVGYWVTYSGGAGAWTGWTVNIQTALAGDVTFNYVVIGNR